MIGGGDFLLGIQTGSDAHLHVGLPGAQPDFADEHVLKFNGVGAGNSQHVGPASGSLRQRHLPLSGGVGPGAGNLITELHRDLLSGISPAPDRQRHVPLQYHVTAENRGQTNIRQNHGWQGPEQGQGDDVAGFAHGSSRRQDAATGCSDGTAQLSGLTHTWSSRAQGLPCDTPPPHTGASAGDLHTDKD